MPPPTEMQQMEMDMVQGMYDTYELISEDPPTYAVLLAASADDAPELRVIIIYETEDYPETATPTVRLEHIAKHRRMQTASLSKEISELCEEQIGMHSVISILQRAQEYVTEYAAIEEKAELQRRGEALSKAAAAASTNNAPDPTVRIGTAVTKELFEAWSKKHNAAKQQLREAAGETKATTKLTGKQMWDNTLKVADWELFGVSDDEQDVDFFALPRNDDDDNGEEHEEEMEYDLDDPEEIS